MENKKPLTKTQTVLLKRLLEGHESAEIVATPDDVMAILEMSKQRFLFQIGDKHEMKIKALPPEGPEPRKAKWWEF